MKGKIIRFISNLSGLSGFGSVLSEVVIPHLLKNPRYLPAGYRLMRSLKRNQNLRKKHLGRGLMVPPALVLSVTSRCNLNCAGCFAATVGILDEKREREELRTGEWRSIMEEACELGVFCFVISGGEPFLRPNILSLVGEFKDRFFILLTNGTEIDSEVLEDLKGINNLIVLVSLEGGEKLTDLRRGKGVFDHSIESLRKIRGTGTPAGISVTITRRNFWYWMRRDVIDWFVKKGVKLGVFIEYIPSENASFSEGGGRSLMLTPKQREEFRKRMLSYRKEKDMYIIHSPGDEEFFGGCVSAGRGFAHVTPSGDLTPCPVSDVSTHNLTQSRLEAGLLSPLFEEIRKSEHLLKTVGMPCALMAHPEEVDELVRKVNVR